MSKTKTLPVCLFLVWIIGSLELGAYLVFGAWDLDFIFLAVRRTP
jgi:hypothetical protein